MSRKLALVIGNSEYADTTLAQLVTPDADVRALATVLRAPEIGDFDEVILLVNELESAVRRAIARFFAQKRRDDLLLLYFSGHGVLDDQGHLYLAVKDTEHTLLSATAIPAALVTYEMDNSHSRRQVLILDCCHSGAFARGTKSVPGASVGTAAAFEGNGYGRVVLTATDATQYAWEGAEIIGQAENSVFTHYLVQGLQTGEADADNDGQITLDELYSYVYDRMVDTMPRQTPGKWSYKQLGEINLAKNPRPVVKLAATLDLKPIVPAQNDSASTLIPPYRLKQTLSKQVRGILCIAFSPHGRWLVSAGADGAVRLWDAATGENSHTLQGHNAPVYALRFSPSGRELVSASMDNKILLWEVASGIIQRMLSGHLKTILSVSFHPDGRLLASAGYDSIIRLWNTTNSVCSMHWHSGQSVVHAVTFSPDGGLLASAGDNTIKLWDVTTGGLVRTLMAHGNSIYCLCFSPDGSLLASGSRDTVIKLWTTVSWTPKQVLRQHSRSVLCLAFSCNGRVLASGSADNTIKLWDTETGNMVRSIESRQLAVHFIDFSPDGGVLASGGADGTIKLWEQVRSRYSPRFLKQSEL